MPDSLHPPFVATATTQPRQLIRWLDINPQGGPLRRTQTFITLPAFSAPFTWKGYSEIVAAFNFEAPNNFSFTSLVGELPASPNYLLCVMWDDSLGNVHRYAFWRGVGEVIFFPLSLYAGQLVKKNFRLEIWSTPTSPAVQNTPFNIYTTVLGILDYRYGVDSSLQNADAIVTNFQNIDSQDSLPVAIGLKYRWNINSGFVHGVSFFTSWTDSVSNKVFLPVGGNVSVGLSAGLNSVFTIVKNQSGNDLGVDITADNVKLNTIAAGVYFGTDSNVFSDSNNDNAVSFAIAGGTLTLKQQGVTVASVAGLSLATWYTVVASVNTLWVYKMSTSILVGKSTIGAAAIGNATFLNAGTEIYQYLELILGTNVPADIDAQNLSNYFTNTYFPNGSFSLPLVFPPGANSQNN